MAVTFDAVGPSATGFVNTATVANTPVTWTHVVGAGTGRYLVVGVSVGATAASTGTLTVTFAGTAMTQLGNVESYAAGGGYGEVWLFGLLNPASGSGTVSVTSSVAGAVTGGSVSFAGAASVGTAVTASGHGTAVTASVTGTATTNMVTAHMGAGSALSSTGNTQRYIATGNGATSAGNSAGSTAASAAGTVTMTGTVSATDDWGIVAVEIIAATGTVYTQTEADSAGAADAVWASPQITTLVTDFSALPAFFDGNFGGAAIVGNQASVPTVAGYAAFKTTETYTLTGKSVFVQVVTASGTSGTRQNSLKCVVDANNSVEMMLDGGVFHGRVTKAGANTDVTLATYNATTHAWWRVREGGGTVYWDTAPDGATWTNLGSATHGLALGAVQLLLQAGYYGTETGTVPAVYDNLNTNGVAWIQTVADAAGAADATSSAASYAPSVGDAAGAADTASGASTYAQTASDATAVVDSASYRAAFGRGPADAIGVSDASSSTAAYAPSLNDPAGAADAATSTATYTQSFADTAGVGDSPGLGHLLSLADAIGVGDAQSLDAGYSQTFTDVAGTADAVQAADAEGNAVADVAYVGDALAAQVTSQRTASSDAIGVGDQASAALGHSLTRSATDAIGVGDRVTDVTHVAVGQPADEAVEADSAFTLPAPPAASMPVPVAVETDAAFTLHSQAQLAAPQASPEADSAWTPRPTGSRGAPESAEIDLTFPPIVLVDDGTFGDAIDDADRVPVYVFKADWGRTGLYDHPLSDLTDFVTSVVVDRGITGSLPAEIGIVEGYATAQLTVTLEGAWQDPAGAISMDPVDVFAPYRTDSPLYGKAVLRTPVYLETGFVTADGPRLQRRFTGTVTSINPSSAARTVKLGALDLTSSMRASFSIYGGGLYQGVLASYGADAYRSRINSQWLIDRALRANGIYASPPARSDAILSVTGHGSMIPEIGSGGAPEQIYTTYRGDMWERGPFGPLTTVGGEVGRWWAPTQLTAAAGSGFGFSMWLNMAPADGNDHQLLSFDTTFDQSWMLNFGIGTDGRPYFDAFSEGTTSHRAVATGYTPPTNYGWQFVGVHVAIGSPTFTVTFRINGASYTSTVTYGNSPMGSSYQSNPIVYYDWTRQFTNFQVWLSTTPPSAPWQGEDPNWVPQADLDEGVNMLTGIPTMQKVDSWSLIQQIADAEGSVFQFTEDGRAQFLTSIGDVQNGRQHPVTETMTADRNLADLVSTTDESTIRNVINVKTKRVLVMDWADYFKATDTVQFETPPGESVYDIPCTPDVYDFPANRSTGGADAALDDLDTSSYVYYTQKADWEAAQNNNQTPGLIRVFLIDAGDAGNELTAVPNIYMRLERTSPTNLRLFITNTSDITVRFATPSTQDSSEAWHPGDPALIIPARLIATEDAEQIETYTDNGSVALYGESSFDVGGSDEMWRQLPDGLRTLATEVLATTAHPVPVLDAVDVPHDPRRKVGNRVIIEDPDGLGSVEGSIVNLETTYDAGGAIDKVTVRPLSAPGIAASSTSAAALDSRAQRALSRPPTLPRTQRAVIQRRG